MINSLVAIRAKANQHYTCQECGATELIQAHHQVRGDDSSLISLCAECHSQKHPNVPKALFFNTDNQPYWYNKSAASLAKSWGLCSRTIIRAAKRLTVPKGILSEDDEDRIKRAVLGRKPLTERNKKKKRSNELLTVPNAAKMLGKPKMTLYRWLDSKRLIGVEVGGIWFIPISEIERLKGDGHASSW